MTSLKMCLIATKNPRNWKFETNLDPLSLQYRAMKRFNIYLVINLISKMLTIII